MIDLIRRFFSRVTEGNSKAADRKTYHDTRVATCALFMEIARIDGKFVQEEMDKILSIIEKKYGVSREYTDELIAEAEKELDGSVDLWQFARLVNANYSFEEKIEIIETLWRIVYVDGKIDKYEHYLINKLENLLRLSQSQLIDAKLKVFQSELAV